MVGVSGLLGLALSGCAPAPEKSQPSSVEQPAPTQSEEPAQPTVEEPAELPAPETEEPAAPAEPTGKSAPEPMEPPAEEPATKPAPEEPAAPAEPTEKPAETSEKPAETSEKPAETSEKPAETSEKPAETSEKAEEKPAAESAAAAVDPSKVSTYASAADLASQVPEYLGELEDSVKDEDEYADSQTKLIKDANVLILVALALGLHDEDNPYKNAAPAMIKAAQELAAATDYASAKAAIEKVKEAAASTDGDPSTLAWEKVASLPELMKAVPLIHSRLKRYLRGSRFESYADTTAGLTAVVAVVAQGSMPNADDTDLPNEVEQWHKFCAQMRDASVVVHDAIRAQDEPAAEAGMEKLQQSCDACHAVFHPEPLPVLEEQQ
jgi:hypothetical protein